MLPPRVREGGLTVEQIYELFPNLQERRASQGTKLYGGEQQMLAIRSEEHTSELQSLMRISYAVFCLKKKKTQMHYTQRNSEEHNEYSQALMNISHELLCL